LRKEDRRRKKWLDKELFVEKCRGIQTVPLSGPVFYALRIFMYETNYF
jgi:hypothetical protein